ncbi:phosphate signaling complex protein PhoU [Tsukamurella sp. DT100]|uniref:phosphate signaling complex protein PhoU n=1 Tax=Tsukamurella sp. DT100 TaxID=3393415 RepID=UPI003CF4CE3E
MRDDFQERLDELSTTLVTMCDIADGAIVAASSALNESNLAAAEQAVDRSAQLTAMEEPAQSQAMLLLALQAPVGRDLRQIVASVHLIGDLVRMGQLAEHVAKVVRRNHPVDTGGAARPILIQMGEVAHELISAAKHVLADPDPSHAASIDARDDVMDRLADELSDVVLSDESISVPEAIDAVLLCRFFERFGDHAVSVGRRIVYLATGTFPEPASSEQRD